MDEAKRKLCTVLLLQNDCETLKTIKQKHHEPITNLCIIPYFALFCRSYQEYAGLTVIDPEIDSQVYDIRNSIKTFSDRYARSKKRFLTTDEQQNKDFRELLRFGFMKDWNIHFNLGLYFDKEGHIVGNTQLCFDVLGMNNLTDEDRAKKAYALGEYMGKVIGSVSTSLSESITAPTIQVADSELVFYYEDINTNNSLFLNPNFSKDINLYCLHLLSILGFVKYILEPIVLRENPWIFRIKYITIHYAISGLKALKASFENDRLKNSNNLYQNISEVLASCEYLKVTNFRNCMMHYDLVENGSFIIHDVHFDWNKPLFGLVEECFDMPYEACFDKLSAAASQIESCLSELFDYGCLQIKELE